MNEISGEWACGGERGMADERGDNDPAGERRTVPARFSRHALCRAARRNVVPDAVEYVLANGRVVHRTGITFYFLAARDVPALDRRTSWAARLVGTVVLMGPDGEIITVYRNRRALPTIRRKVKYRLAPTGRAIVKSDPWEGVSSRRLHEAVSPARRTHHENRFHGTLERLPYTRDLAMSRTRIAVGQAETGWWSNGGARFDCDCLTG